MTDQIDNTKDVIDSRDVIARIETLEQFFDDLPESEGHEADYEEFRELQDLRSLQEDAESSPDWFHGETLIRRSYFVDYIKELISDCYEVPKEFNSGNWPFRHMTMDYQAAADEAEIDYRSVDFAGVEYLIRA